MRVHSAAEIILRMDFEPADGRVRFEQCPIMRGAKADAGKYLVGGMHTYSLIISECLFCRGRTIDQLLAKAFRNGHEAVTILGALPGAGIGSAFAVVLTCF